MDLFETELKTICRLVDLLAEASWMSEKTGHPLS